MKRLSITDIKRVLIVRPDRIGDLVLSLPMAAAFKEVSPNIRVEFLVSHYAAPVLRYSPHVDDCLIYTDVYGKTLPMDEIIVKVESRGYDAAVFAKPNWKSAMAIYLSGVNLRIGTSRRPYSFLFNVRFDISRKTSGMHETDLNLKLLKCFKIPRQPGLRNPELRIPTGISDSAKSIELPEKYAVIHIGSKGSAANWPASKYIKLAAKLSTQLPVVITGQEEIRSNSDNIIYMINRTSLDELINIIARCSLFVSGSTGPMHLAAALSRKVLALFPDHPYHGAQRWGPRTENAIILAPPKQNGHRCRIKLDGSCDCMDLISIEMAIKAARELLT